MRFCPISTMLPYQDLATPILSSGFYAKKRKFQLPQQRQRRARLHLWSAPSLQHCRNVSGSARWQQILHKDPGQPTVIASSPAAASKSSPHLCCPGQPYAYRAMLNTPSSLGCITEQQ
ncbi:uncharacterized protein LOC142784969 [Rhipicephalus microplus]|uniref:uncharacterized protein LOC142784969 n=1 Tax=Rhipicephalus microplus TaxID=6941 RepID=UPI003F6BD2C9